VSDKKSQYRGVTWYYPYNKWVVHVFYKNKRYYVGYFEDELEAAKEYDKKAIEIKGKSARLNFNDSWKFCEICGDKSLYLYKNSIYLCKKHISQMNQFGFIFDRTIHDNNEIITYENYAEIVLYDYQSQEIARTKIDLKYINLIKDIKWYLKDNGYVATNNYKGNFIHLHSLILNIDEKELEVDHKDGNKLNNLYKNLRSSTRSQNEQNKGLRKHNTSGVTGVRFVKERGDWHSGICIDGERIHLGYFNSFEEAVKIRKEAEVMYFKEFRYKGEV